MIDRLIALADRINITLLVIVCMICIYTWPGMTLWPSNFLYGAS